MISSPMQSPDSSRSALSTEGAVEKLGNLQKRPAASITTVRLEGRGHGAKGAL
jgi:hypothetical protein